MGLSDYCSDGGGVKFYCLGFTAVVCCGMCSAAIHRHRFSVCDLLSMVGTLWLKGYMQVEYLQIAVGT